MTSRRLIVTSTHALSEGLVIGAFVDALEIRRGFHQKKNSWRRAETVLAFYLVFRIMFCLFWLGFCPRVVISVGMVELWKREAGGYHAI